MYQQILITKKLEQQALAAMHFWRFDVPQYDKWENRATSLHEHLESLRGDWITQAYYESVNRDI